MNNSTDEHAVTRREEWLFSLLAAATVFFHLVCQSDWAEAGFQPTKAGTISSSAAITPDRPSAGRFVVLSIGRISLLVT